MRDSPEFQGLLAQLRPREQEVLRQVARGATVQQVATALGISCSTVDKHLASVRRRLGVLRTAEAVVIFWQNHARRQREQDIPRETIADGGAPAAPFARFAAQLPEIADFDTAWDRLCACLEHVGLASPVFGVLAEPFGHLTGGVKMLKWPLNRDLDRQYERAGGQLRNPVSVAVATNRATTVIGREALVRHFSDHLPERQAGIVASQLIPEENALAVNLPGQDVGTGAPFAITCLGRRDTVAQLHEDDRAQDRQLRALITLFWNHCKAQGWVARTTGLTGREREALSLAACGMNGAELAERLDVSYRGAQKVLHGARARLRAPTTTAAIYRATVFGAI